MAASPEDTQATFCATLVDEWVRCGVEHAVVSPGSRSTPLALALAGDGRIRLQVHHDERSAGFLAIGLALVGREPTVVLTTSGTAAVELHPAVVEADLAGVPLIVCTADRPPELIDVGAPQAIDQTHLFGRSVRWFHAPGVADPSGAARWRATAGRAYAEATAGRGGPVHLNLAFREPLVGTPHELPAGRQPDGASWVWRPPRAHVADPVISAVEDLAGRRGVIIAGAGSGDADLVVELAEALGWPLVAAPQAPCWSRPEATVGGLDALLRIDAVRADLIPEVVVHLGGPLASRVVGEWIRDTGAVEIVVTDQPRWLDPHGTATVVLDVEPAAQAAAWVDELLRASAAMGPVPPAEWSGRWSAASTAARGAIARVIAETEADGPTEPGSIQATLGSLPAGAHVVVSSSMPIRDLEWYAQASRPLSVHSNRGANGIDGVVSTAVGVATASGAPTSLLIGDVAFLHDSNGLIGAAQRGIDLVVVVIDNDGGGIFSFLPQADSTAADVFERLYGTPHGLDLAAVARAVGVSASHVDEVAPAVANAVAEGGVHVLVVKTDRAANRTLHQHLNAAVAAAVGDA